MFSDDSPIVLNAGSGEKQVCDRIAFFKDWKELTLDLYDERADINCDITTLDKVPNDSVDCVWASHVIEHLYWHELPKTFENFSRVLKPNGFAIIVVPDLGAIADRIKENLMDPVVEFNGLTTLDFIYGGRYYHERDGIGQLHKTGFTSKSMSQLLNNFGINGCVKEKNFQVYAVCFKGEVNQELLNNI